MRISYAIILATAAVSFEGCKVEKAAGVTNEGKDKKKVAQLDEKNRLDGGDGAGLGPDGEGGDEEHVDDEDVAVPKLTPSKTKAAAVAKAKEAVQTATKARDDAKAALIGSRDQLIGAMTAENAIPPLQPTADAQAFIAAVRGVVRSEDGALQRSHDALIAITGTLPADVTQAKEALLAAITDELSSDDGKITAGRDLVGAIKALAPVQFAITQDALQAAIALAQNVREAAANNVDALQRQLLAAIPDRADIPQGEPAPVTAMFEQVAALRGLINGPEPDIVALRAALIGSFDAGDGNIPAAVLAARRGIADPGAANADFGPLLNAIGDNAVPNVDEYAAVLLAYAPLRDAMDRLARITAARDALLDTLVPAAALPVPEAIIARVRGINLEGDGDIPAKIEALGHLRTAIGADLAALRAPHDQALARIAAYPGATDAAKAICDGLIASLTPADQLHDAIRQYRGAIGEQGVSEGAREQAKQALITAAIDVASVDQRVSRLQTYTPYTNAKALVTRMEQSLAAAQTDLAKLENPTTTSANANANAATP